MANRFRHCVRGSTYLVILGAAALVTLIGLSALLAVRLQGRSTSGVNDSGEARLYAQAAVEMGMFWVRQDPFWRTHRGNGAWATDVPIGSGRFSLEASDPVDGDVRTGDNDPVLLIGTGMKGQARYRMQARLEVTQTLGTCLEVSLHAGHDAVMDAATLTSDQILSANHDTDGKNGAQIYADVEAVNNIKGGTYNGTTTAPVKARTMPDPAAVLTYYTTNGTPIAYSDLRLWGTTEILANTSFETAVLPWRPLGVCQLERSTDYRKDGAYALYVRGRADSSATAGQDLDPAKVLNGNRYFVRIPVVVKADSICQATLIVQSTDGGTQSFSTPATACSASSWVDLEGQITPTWTGQLVQATVTITINKECQYYIDKPTLYDTTYPADCYVMDRALLSPATNPFGSRQTNPQGIYVLNCSDRKIIIANSRIVGTLVLIGANSASVIQKSVAWEPATPNFPALLTDRQITISTSAVALSETTMNANFNPPGTPFPYIGGVEDLDLNDAYPSVIRGLVYSKTNLLFANRPCLEGVVVVHNDLTAQAATLELKYNSAPLNNPPPGFTTGTGRTMKMVSGTWRRVVP